MPRVVPCRVSSKEPVDLFEVLGGMSEAMIFITDLATAKTLWVNETLVEMTGYTLEDYQFERFENPFMPPEDIEHIGRVLAEFLPSDEKTSGIVRNRFVDRWGGTLHVRSRIAKIEWKGEPALLYSTVLEDPNLRQGVEVEQRYRSLVEAATDSIVRLRPDLTVQFSNQCFRELLGKTPVELNAQPFTELVLSGHRERAKKRLLDGSERFTLNVPLLGRDEESVWLEGTFVRIAAGNDAGLLQAILRNTTESRRLNERMQHTQKRETLGQMAGGIAHDMNNILTGVLGSAALAERAIQKGESATKALANIRLSALRAGELSASMLAYAGEGNAERLPIDLAQLSAEMKPLLASGVARGLELQVITSDMPIPVMADEVQIRQVVMNLITNAADATRATGGPIEVEAGIQNISESPLKDARVFGVLPDGVRVAFVRVSDRGEGMSEEVLSRIFDPFFSTKAKGRGLGLAAALGILDRHGGCVRVTSSPEAGTQMEIVLPLHGQGIEQTEPEASQPLTGKGVVLVVDDEEHILGVVGSILGSLGFEVLQAASGEEALELVHDEVRAVILDQTMPGMNGDETLAEIRSRFPRMPVVRTSGYSADMNVARDEQTTFIGKPFGLNELVGAIHSVIRPRSDD